MRYNRLMTIATDKKQSVALSSVFASLVLTLIKLVVGLLSGSMGIISEAAHSALDLGAALLTYFAVRVSAKPADEDHHYGHNKIESVSALIETGLLFLTSAWIIYESIHRLLGAKVEVEISWYAFAVVIVSILIDISRSRALSKVAKETNSQALEADALHFRSDILSSLVVLIGLVFVAFNVNSADIYAAIGVSLFVAHAGYQLGKRTIDVLTDTAPVGVKEEILKIVQKNKSVLGVKKVRVRPLGPDTFIDMTLYVSRQLPLIKSHEITRSIISQIRKKIPGSDVTVHTKPFTADSETIVERVKFAAAKNNLQVHDIVIYDQDGKKFLNYNLEIDENLSLEKAHKIATQLEKDILNEMDEAVEINTHLEPLRSLVISGEQVPEAEEKKIISKMEVLVKKMGPVKNLHNVKIRKTDNKIFVSFHCSFDGSLSIEKVHTAVDGLEYAIKTALPIIHHVVIHAEPHFKGSTACHQH